MAMDSSLHDVSYKLTLPEMHDEKSALMDESALAMQGLGEFGDKSDRRRNTNENLQRSIYLLEDAVGTARKGKTLRSRQPGSPMLLNMSQRNTSLNMTSVHPANTSMGLSFNEGLGTTFTTKMEPPEFTSDITMLMNDDPGISASSSVFTDFMHSLNKHPADHQIFDLLTSYESICQEQVSMLRGLVNIAAPHQQKFDQAVTTLYLLEQEFHTWTLLHSLFKDRLKSEFADSMDESQLESLDKYKSDRDVVEQLYKQNSSISQAQLVVDWLEHSAVQDCDKLNENPASFMDKAVAWENTLHKLERKKTTMSSHGRKLIDQMDPDAPFRQSGHLDDLDKDDESRLLKYLFVCVRAGQLDRAQEMCVQCGQPWRAATFEGWRLHHDPNYNELGRDGVLGSVVGNHMRDVWRVVCWRMADDPAVSAYEKAIYGSCCGHLASILAVCRSWQDYVWAYYRVFIDRAIETELRVSYMGVRPLEDLPAAYWQKELNPEAIFRDIEACNVELVRREAMEWFAIIQKHVILMDFDGLVEVFYSWTQSYQDGLPKHLLRFMTHIILYLRRIGHNAKEELCMSVLEAYVRYLIEDDLTDLVATYVRALPPHSQVIWYAKFLQDIEDTERRQYGLRLAESAGLNVHEITKLVVENIRSEATVDFRGGLEPGVEQSISEDDRRKISAIDWLVYDKTQRAEAMLQANAIMRSFIALKKTEACRDVMNKISPDSLAIIKKNWKLQTGSDELPPQIDSTVRECAAISAYLDSMEAFNLWFNYLHHNKPTPPSQPPSTSFTDQVAFEHRQKQYDIEVERWKQTLAQYTKSGKETIYNVLLFPQGWMTNVHEVHGGDEGRLLQMSRLRQLCIPQMCILLHTILHKSHSYAECLQLADVVAAEDCKIYLEFQTEDLQRFLGLLRDTSLALLASQPDPLGYNS